MIWGILKRPCNDSARSSAWLYFLCIVHFSSLAKYVLPECCDMCVCVCVQMSTKILRHKPAEIMIILKVKRSRKGGKEKQRGWTTCFIGRTMIVFFVMLISFSSIFEGPIPHDNSAFILQKLLYELYLSIMDD